MKKVVIAISGGSCSGKSTLVQALKNHFNHRIAILQQDNYYLSFDHLTISERSELNFDDPSLIDFKLMQQHLHDLISGQIIKQPFYDFKLHLRKEETKEVNSEPIIILDGLHVLGRLEFRDKINLAVFLDVPEEIRIKRRIDRDQKERGRSEISIKKQLHQQVLPMHQIHIEEQKNIADLIIEHQAENEKNALSLVLKALENNNIDPNSIN